MLVTGTGTGVGKTWVSAALLAELRGRGLRVGARKPVQSFDPDEAGPTDAEVLAAATGEPPDAVCPSAASYPVAMTPFMAADVLGRHLPAMGELVGELSWPVGLDVGLVEGVGGVRSPIWESGDDTLAMARLLAPDASVLVADAGLGALHAVRLSLDVLPPPVIVFLNRFDPTDDLHRRNRGWLEAHVWSAVVVSVADLALSVSAVAPPAGEMST